MNSNVDQYRWYPLRCAQASGGGGLMVIGGRYEAGFDLVHTDMLRFFPDLVSELGGDTQALLRHAGIAPSIFSTGRASLSYRAMVNLLEHAAEQLQCADFGMRLASLQGGGQVFGPIGIVMKNATTFGEGLDYVQ